MSKIYFDFRNGIGELPDCKEIDFKSVRCELLGSHENLKENYKFHALKFTINNEETVEVVSILGHSRDEDLDVGKYTELIEREMHKLFIEPREIGLPLDFSFFPIYAMHLINNERKEIIDFKTWGNSIEVSNIKLV